MSQRGAANQSAVTRWVWLSGIALLIGVGFFTMTGAPAIGLAFGVLTGAILFLVQKQSAVRRVRLTRNAWPDLVDDLHSAIRAGVALPMAIVSMGERAPSHMQPYFKAFAARYRVSGSFESSISELQGALSDPIAARVFAALRLTNRVGGSDLGAVLKSLSDMLREDARLRGELEARQSWTINAARLAVAAPWLVLGLMSLRPAAVVAYRSWAGALVLVGVLLISGLAYYLMVRAARLPNLA